MDSIDEEILEHLSQDGRASYTEIAEKLDVSEGTVRNRVQKMEEEEVIEKFTVNVNRKKIQAFVSINVSTERDFNDLLEELPESTSCYELAGDIDLIVEISRDSSEEINKVVDNIREADGVKDTNTYMVLSEN
jgi:DNA-binding Lrp family transcriptional regulator